jgi:hypothetical protein
MEKSWNQLYRESGTTLSYKEWRKREDEKMASFDGIPSPSLADSVSFKDTALEIQKKGGLKDQLSGKTVLGINKVVLVIAGIVVVSAIAYKFYKKSKS